MALRRLALARTLEPSSAARPNLTIPAAGQSSANLDTSETNRARWSSLTQSAINGDIKNTWYRS